MSQCPDKCFKNSHISRPISRSEYNNMVLLLTATVDPREIVLLKRKDPIIRFHDYKKALYQWLSVPYPRKIVFCENSTWDLKELKQLYNRYNPYNKELEILSFNGNNYTRCLGKGYGDVEIIKYFIENSKLPSSNDLVLKVSGRYIVKNIKSIVNGILIHPEVDIFCDLRHNLTISDSRVFCASIQFLKKYLIPMQDKIDDSTGTFMEHILARAALICIANGGIWRTLPRYPRIEGISGTGNSKYRSSTLFNIKWDTINKIKKIILTY